MSEIIIEQNNEDDTDLLVDQIDADLGDQYVIFSIAGEEYGVPILGVQEIISLPNLTRIPGVSDDIYGLINLRGNIIPLYALRARFNLEEEELTDNSIVIVAQVGDSKSKTFGFIVDSVADVVSISEENISEAPDFSTKINVNFIDKIGKVDERMIILINMADFLTDINSDAIESSL